MNWFRRTRRVKMKPFDESALPEAKPPSVEEATSDGLMLAEHAGRMTLKNIIIVGALGGRDPYDAAQYLDAAAGVLNQLAEEFKQDGTRVAQALRSIENRSGNATRAHDYQSADTENLRVRQAVLSSLVAHLRGRRDDRTYLLELIESARKDAWGDISRVMQDSLDRSVVVVDATYQRARRERMRLLGEDLVGLAAQRDRRSAGEAEPGNTPH